MREFLKLMESAGTSARKLSIGTAVSPVLEANPKRIGLWVGVTSNNRANIGPDPNLVLDQGLSLNFRFQPIFLSLLDVGPKLKGPWWGIASVATSLGVIEVVRS